MHSFVKSHVTWSCCWYIKQMTNGKWTRDPTTRVSSTWNMTGAKPLPWQRWCGCRREKWDYNLKLKWYLRSQLWLRGGKSPGDISAGYWIIQISHSLSWNLETSVREPSTESVHTIHQVTFPWSILCRALKVPTCKRRISTVFIYLMFARLGSQEEKCSANSTHSQTIGKVIWRMTKSPLPNSTLQFEEKLDLSYSRIQVI